MQKLHPVGFTTELDGLVLSARKGAKTGRFILPLDGKLLQQLAEAERRRDGTQRDEQHRMASPRLVRPESALTPREMQDRIRAGWSLDEVAAEAGVDLDWVRRFASPVLAEVARVVQRAQATAYDKPRFGVSALPLGSSVRRNVAERGVRLIDDDLDEAWSAYQLDEDVWVVRFVYTSRGRAQEAEWLFDIATEELTSHNRLASQLGYVARARSKKPAPAPAPAAPRRPTPAKKAKAAAPARKPAAKAAPMPIIASAASGSASRTRRAPRKKAAARPAKRPSKKRARTAPPPPVEPPAWRPTPPSTPPPRPRIVEPELPPRGPLPAPAPLPVPPAVREAVATPIGDDTEPPKPGAVDIDYETGIAHIDSRRLGHYVSSPPRRPRRSEPLRGR